MKRFTETEKWRDSWFQGLSPDAKLVFCYMADTCDAAGVWDPNQRLAEFSIGKKVNWKAVYAELTPKIQTLASGKLFLARFIAFQYGELTENCAPHRKVLRVLEMHGIKYPLPTLSLEYIKGSNTPIYKEEEEDKDKGTDTDTADRPKIPPDPADVTAYSLEIGYPLDGQAWCDSYAQKGWAVGKGRMKDWKAAVRNWKANGWTPNKTKPGAGGNLEERFNKW